MNTKLCLFFIAGLRANAFSHHPRITTQRLPSAQTACARLEPRGVHARLPPITSTAPNQGGENPSIKHRSLQSIKKVVMPVVVASLVPITMVMVAVAGKFHRCKQ
jgi:hypothetical protein